MNRFQSYLAALSELAATATATTGTGEALDLDRTVETMGRDLRATHDQGNKIIFIGNGGSAGISSHMAIDFTKNGGMRALALNDGAALTCLANDLGYDQVFAKQIELHARAGDALVAISSSGRSPNITNAVAVARDRGCRVFTLSGFDADNPLRGTGDVNIFVDSREYGFIEIGHAAILHAVLDIEQGWLAQA